MKLTKRQLKQIIKEELQEMRAFDPNKEFYGQGLSRDDTLYYEPEGEAFDPASLGTRVKYNDKAPGAKIFGTSQGFSKKHPEYIRVEWDRTTDFINARGQERPGVASGPKGTFSDVDPRLLSPGPPKEQGVDV
jgi:hypothetical protein